MSNWSLCLLCSILFNFSETKCISKCQRKLMNYKSENRIPWLFTDFDSIKDFPWLFKKFPDLSLTLKSFAFPWLFPDRGNSVYCTDFLPCILKFYADQLLVFYWLQVQVQIFQRKFCLLLVYGESWITSERHFLKDPWRASLLALARSTTYIIYILVKTSSDEALNKVCHGQEALSREGL